LNVPWKRPAAHTEPLRSLTSVMIGAEQHAERDEEADDQARDRRDSCGRRRRSLGACHTPHTKPVPSDARQKPLGAPQCADSRASQALRVNVRITHVDERAEHNASADYDGRAEIGRIGAACDRSCALRLAQPSAREASPDIDVSAI
jgi:hypothetical protein